MPQTHPTLNIQPQQPHQRKSITLWHDAFAHLIIKSHLAVDPLVAEVDVLRRGVELFDDVAESQVVRGDEAEGTCFQQAFDHAAGANEPVVELVPWRISSSRKRTVGESAC